MRMFRVQDKGSRLVIESKEEYKEKMLKYLENKNIFEDDQTDSIKENEEKVNKWVKKWEREDQIGEVEIDYTNCCDTNHAKAYANIKTHKQGWPYRYIISCRGSAIEKLGRWVECQLKNPAQKHQTYLKDTKHFLNFIEDLNENQGPFKKDEIIMVSRDTENFYPSCDKDKCIQAIKILIDTSTYQIPSKECILEAVDITMSSNTGHFYN